MLNIDGGLWQRLISLIWYVWQCRESDSLRAGTRHKDNMHRPMRGITLVWLKESMMDTSFSNLFLSLADSRAEGQKGRIIF